MRLRDTTNPSFLFGTDLTRFASLFERHGLSCQGSDISHHRYCFLGHILNGLCARYAGNAFPSGCRSVVHTLQRPREVAIWFSQVLYSLSVDRTFPLEHLRAACVAVGIMLDANTHHTRKLGPAGQTAGMTLL
jgi:hypothetical protein